MSVGILLEYFFFRKLLKSELSKTVSHSPISLASLPTSNSQRKDYVFTAFSTSAYDVTYDKENSSHHDKLTAKRACEAKGNWEMVY